MEVGIWGVKKGGIREIGGSKVGIWQIGVTKLGIGDIGFPVSPPLPNGGQHN